MQFKLLLSIALNHLISRKRQTIVAALGVTFGIGLFISLLSFMTGINDLLDGLMLKAIPHVSITAEPTADQRLINSHPAYQETHNFVSSITPRGRLQHIRNGHTILATLREDPRVAGATPRLNTGVFFLAGTTEINGVIRGIEPEGEAQLYGFNDNIIQGDLFDLNRVSNGIVLGTDLAEDLDVAPGDQVSVTTSDGKRRLLKVVAISQLGMKEVDGTHGYMHIRGVQNLMEKHPAFYSEIAVQMKDIREAAAAAPDFEQQFGTRAVDYLSGNAQIETGSGVRNMISYAVGITLLIVAGFGIYNILNIMIYEKMNEIAILKAMGFSARDVNVIFISQAVIIGLIGGTVGLILGYVLSAIVDQLPFSTPALPVLETFPVNFDPKYYLLCISFALVTTFLAGYFPARKAGGIDPVEIIRNQ